MIHPLFGDTVTLYRRSGESYTRTILRGVQFRQKAERANRDALSTQGTIMFQTVTTVTIPASVSAGKTISPISGDVLILGVGPEITQEYTIAHLRADYSSYCTVRAVSDNTHRPRLKHWKVYAV